MSQEKEQVLGKCQRMNGYGKMIVILKVRVMKIKVYKIKNLMIVKRNKKLLIMKIIIKKNEFWLFFYLIIKIKKYL